MDLTQRESKLYKDCEALAELLGIRNFSVRDSVYADVEITWTDDTGKWRVVTYVASGRDQFAYTKNVDGLDGDWQLVDYYFLYL